MMNKMYNPYGKDFGLLVLRLGLAVIFIWHGIDKLQNMEQVIGFFGMLGLSSIWAWVIALVELVGGILMLLGLFTGFAGIALGAVMIGAIFLVKYKMLGDKGFTVAEIDIALMCMSIGVAMTGPGRFSLGYLIWRKCKCTSVCVENNCAKGSCTCAPAVEK